MDVSKPCPKTGCRGTYKQEMVEETPECDNCGFNPSQCSHPLDERTYDTITDLDVGGVRSREICGRCWKPLE